MICSDGRRGNFEAARETESLTENRLYSLFITGLLTGISQHQVDISGEFVASALSKLNPNRG